MAGALFHVSLPQNLQPFVSNVRAGDGVNEKTALLIIEGLLLSGTVTLEKAAELAGMNIMEFMDILKAQDLPWGSYTEEEYREDLSTLELLKEQNS